MYKCPRCGLEVSELQTVDADLMNKAQTINESISGQICRGCIVDIRKMVANSSGGVLLAQERAKEKHRLQMWQSRVQLIKKARQCMDHKSYPEALVNYEKYLKILEMVFQCKKGEKLAPEKFKDNARTSELTVVASVYWDLLRLYDIIGHKKQRQSEVAKQLATFIRFTPIFPDIVKKAEVFAKQAKNPDAIKLFLKEASAQRPRCFVATSAFENPQASEVQILRFFRDERLKKNPWGRKFVVNYYRFSPSFAEFLDRHPGLKPLVRATLRIAVRICLKFLK